MEDFFQELGIACYAQGQGMPQRMLLSKFKQDVDSVLFGTGSFWQGIDVPGEALSNVIITRLPFAVAHQTRRLRATRTPTRSKPRAQRPNELWGINMTKILVNSWGWVYLHVVLDWASKKILGYQLSLRSKTADWLSALRGAVNAQFPNAIRESGTLRLVSDDGCQPTSVNHQPKGFSKSPLHSRGPLHPAAACISTRWLRLVRFFGFSILAAPGQMWALWPASAQ